MMWLMAAALSVGILTGCGAGTNGPKNAISGVFSGENGLGVEMAHNNYLQELLGDTNAITVRKHKGISKVNHGN